MLAAAGVTIAAPVLAARIAMPAAGATQL